MVYGGRGQAARSWEAYDAILETLRTLEDDETLLVQSGKPVAVFNSHPDAPRVLIANSNLVPHWATKSDFDDLAARGLIMFGQMTACSCTVSAPRAFYRAHTRRLPLWPSSAAGERCGAGLC